MFDDLPGRLAAIGFGIARELSSVDRLSRETWVQSRYVYGMVQRHRWRQRDLHLDPQAWEWCEHDLFTERLTTREAHAQWIRAYFIPAQAQSVVVAGGFPIGGGNSYLEPNVVTVFEGLTADNPMVNELYNDVFPRLQKYLAALVEEYEVQLDIALTAFRGSLRRTDGGNREFELCALRIARGRAIRERRRAAQGGALRRTDFVLTPATTGLSERAAGVLRWLDVRTIEVFVLRHAGVGRGTITRLLNISEDELGEQEGVLAAALAESGKEGK